MVQLLNSYLDKRVIVMTIDSRIVLGKLISSDNSSNIILSEVIERVIAPHGSEEDGTDTACVGVEIIRGAEILVVGLVDEALEESIDWTKVRGEPLGGTKND